MTFYENVKYFPVVGIEDKKICLYLNKRWEVIGVKSVRDVFNEFSRGDCFGIDISYAQKENGEYDFEDPVLVNPVSWDDWIFLPVRDFDLKINTSKLAIRIPTIVISKSYDKIPPFKHRVSHKKIWMRDGGICQYTGIKLDKDTGNIDHIIPKNRGGKNCWTNMVLCSKEVNSKKGNKTPEEAGLKLIRQPRPPTIKSPSELISDIAHQDWKVFIKK